MNFQRPSPRGTPLMALWVAIGSAIGLCVLPSWVAAQDMVSLRSSATIAGDGAVRLDQIAEISGPGAARLSAVILDTSDLAENRAGWVSIDLERVRRTLEGLGTENWGRLTLRGSTCDARRIVQELPLVVSTEPAAPPLPEGTTVRDLVRARLGQVLGAGEGDLRLEFEADDSKLLDTPTTGLIADVQLIGSSARQPVSVRLYHDQTTVASGRVRVHVGVRRRVAVALGGLRRGQPIEESTFVDEERWVGPTVRPAEPGEVLGQFARGRINPGQVIEVTDIEPPVVVRKGELADVFCLSGGVNVKVKARALEAGRVGDRIDFQFVESARTFKARVDGPSRAITGTGGVEADERTSEVTAARSRTDSTEAGGPAEGTGPRAERPPRSHAVAAKQRLSADRESARAAAREADRRRNLYLDLGDRRLDAPGAGNATPVSVRSGAFNVSRGGTGHEAHIGSGNSLSNRPRSEDRE